MFDSTDTRNAVLTMLGGALSIVSLPLWLAGAAFGVPRVSIGAAAVVPVLLGVGVLEIRARYGDQYGPAGRAGVVLTGLGLAFLFVGVLLFAFFQPEFGQAIFIAGIPLALGVVVPAFGSAFLAVALYRLGVVGPVTAVLVGLGVPLAVPFLLLLQALVPPGLGRGVLVPWFGAAPYGAGWLLVGYRLRETAGEAPSADLGDWSVPLGASPQVVAAAVVGAVYLAFGASRVLSVGPLSVHWLATGSAAVNEAHVLVGGIGLAVAALQDARVARTYNCAVGLLSLTVFAVGPLQLETVRGLRWLPRRATLVNVVLHLPAGVVLAVVGFGLGGGADGDEVDARETDGSGTDADETASKPETE